MRRIQSIKTVILLPPKLKNDGDFAGNVHLEVAGYNHLRVLFVVGTTDTAIGSTAEGTAPKVEECNTTDGSYTDVADAALAGAIADDDDDSLFAIDIDLKSTHKRYMRVNAPHAGAGTTGANLSIIGQLTEGQVTPIDAAGQGLAEHIKA